MPDINGIKFSEFTQANLSAAIRLIGLQNGINIITDPVYPIFGDAAGVAQITTLQSTRIDTDDLFTDKINGAPVVTEASVGSSISQFMSGEGGDAFVTKARAVKVTKVAAAGAALTLDLNAVTNVGAFDITLNNPNCTLTFTNQATPAGLLRSITLFLKQGTGSNLITFPANARYQGGVKPVLAYTAGDLDVITLTSDPTSPTPVWLVSNNGSWPNA